MALRESLKAFFEENKRKMSHGELRIAIGNEACDLDSFISSLVVAYAENAVHVVNMKRSVFMAKGEMVWVCNVFGIDIADLIFFERPTAHFSSKARRIGAYFDAGDAEHSVSGKKIKLLLTDHNNPIEEFADCEIELIIDHHVLSSHISAAKRIYIDLDVGSAATLVSKYLGKDLTRKNHCAPVAVKRDAETETLCASFARLLLIPIVIDTGFLKKRTSWFDLLEYRKLKKIAGTSRSELRKAFKALRSARKNDDQFETSLVLQKDFKRFEHRGFSFGGSTVKFPFEDWVDREGRQITGLSGEQTGMALAMQIESFRRAMGLDFFFVATKNKGVRNIIFANFPFMRTLVARASLRGVEYRGLEYYDASSKLTRKILVPTITTVIDSHLHQ